MKRFIKNVLLLVLGSVILHAQGLNFNDSAYQKVPQKKSNLVASPDGLPSKVDLSMYVPTVIDQGELGTCVGVSTAYYMRTILEAKRRGITDQDSIDALRFSPSFLYNSVKQSNDDECMSGTEIAVALEYMKKHGVAQFAEQGYPYCSKNKPLTVRENSKILDYIKLFGLIDRQENIVSSTKKALAEETPVIVGIQTTPSLDDLGFWPTIWRRILGFFGMDVAEDISLWQPAKSTYLRSGHAVCVVGYDNKKFGGAFQVVNSRGEYWGDDGFFWIRYQDYAKHAKYAFQAYLPVKNDTAKVILSGDVTVEFATFISGTDVPFVRKFIGKTGNQNLNNDEQMVAYSLRDPQPTGTSFKFSANVDKQTYLYVIGANTTQITAEKLFPIADSISAIIGANTKVMLPSEESVYTLVPPRGTEYWLFLFSEKSLTIDSLINQMNDQQGSFANRVMTVLGSELVPYDRIDYKTKKIGFERKGNPQGHIVPLLISFKHVRKEGFEF